MLRDGFGRKIDYLRLSVTDRCNLRCVYCLPERFARFSSREDSLSDDEIVRLVSTFAEMGISRLRITGGEPLVRPGIVGLVGRLAEISDITDISLSTNGMLLAPLAKDLAKAGLHRVNISLDSLRPDTFSRIARFGQLESVLEGVEASLAAGLEPVKLNVVVARGMNDEEIGDFVRLTERQPLHIRFIELMPMGETGFFSKEQWMSMSEILESAAPLEPLPVRDWPLGYGPARYYKRPDARGTVGIISALSCGFCSSCNRVRLSCQGTLVPCLDAADGTDLKSPLRSGEGKDAIRRLILDAIRGKPERHLMQERAQAESANPRLMCQIGG